MAKTRPKSGDPKNRNSSDSDSASVPILKSESELFPQRLKMAMGDASNRAFADRCGMSDRLLGSYLRGEKEPGMESLIKLARGAGVSIDELVTGHAPRAASAYHVHQADCGEDHSSNDRQVTTTPSSNTVQSPGRINRGALAAVLRGAVALIAQGMSDAKAAAIAADMYARALEDGEITPDGVGPGKHADAA